MRLGIRALSDLEIRLGVKRKYLRQFAQVGDAAYSPFPLRRKPKPFQRVIDYKERNIDNPRRELKAIQRRIARRLLDTQSLPDFIQGAVKGKSITTNAGKHLGSPKLVRLDIRKYFPSFEARHVYEVWHTVLGCNSKIAMLLTRLVTYQGHLPQGAPTSTALANIYMAYLLSPIAAEAAIAGVQITVWVDDIAISGSDALHWVERVRRPLAEKGFSFPRRKRVISLKNDSKVLTGTRLGRYHVRALPQALKSIRAGIHKLRAGLIPKSEQPAYLLSLRARLAHVESICPTDAARLKSDFEAVSKSTLKRPSHQCPATQA